MSKKFSREGMIAWIDGKIREIDWMMEMPDCSPGKEDLEDHAMLEAIREVIVAEITTERLEDKLTAGDLKK